MFDRVRHKLSQLTNETRSAFWSLRWRSRPKPVSGLIRVRDGEDFLVPSAESIVSAVDELIIVDNFSRDKTPELIKELLARYPRKVRAYRYDHDVVPVGEDSAVMHRNNKQSPRLAHNYSTWCINLCRHPFVLKWDDDMVATNRLLAEMQKFKRSKYLLFEFGGHNISPDFNHVLNWSAGIEPRIFPAKTRFMMKDFGGVVGEALAGKYLGEVAGVWVTKKNTLRLEEPMYAHLKYCKRNPGSNQSEEFRAKLESGIQTGTNIPEEFRILIRQYLPGVRV